MKNSTKKISLGIAILLVLIISLSVIIINKKEIKNNYSQEQNIMESKENLQGSGVYSFNPVSSKIKWEGKKTLIKDWIDTGKISIQSGNFTLLNDKITEGKIIIDMNSIAAERTGSGQGEDSLSKHLKSEDFFNTEMFPTSQFVMTSITPNEEEYGYLVKGDMTIKNITKSIEFPATIYKEGDSIVGKAEIVIDRTQFDVKFGSTNFFKSIGDKAIDNNFTLRLELVGKKQ